MLYREIIAVCSQIYTKHINTQCGQNVELLNVKPGGTYSKHLTPNSKTGLSLCSRIEWLETLGLLVLTTHTHTHYFHLPVSDFSTLPLRTHWKLVHKSAERSHQLQLSYTSWRHSPMWLRVRNNWLYICGVRTGGSRTCALTFHLQSDVDVLPSICFVRQL